MSKAVICLLLCVSFAKAAEAQSSALRQRTCSNIAAHGGDSFTGLVVSPEALREMFPRTHFSQKMVLLAHDVENGEHQLTYQPVSKQKYNVLAVRGGHYAPSEAQTKNLVLNPAQFKKFKESLKIFGIVQVDVTNAFRRLGSEWNIVRGQTGTVLEIQDTKYVVLRAQKFTASDPREYVQVKYDFSLAVLGPEKPEQGIEVTDERASFSISEHSLTTWGRYSAPLLNGVEVRQVNYVGTANDFFISAVDQLRTPKFMSLANDSSFLVPTMTFSRFEPNLP